MELTEAELSEAGRKMVRHAWVILGYIPIHEMSEAEVERHLRFRLNQARDAHLPAGRLSQPLSTNSCAKSS